MSEIATYDGIEFIEEPNSLISSRETPAIFWLAKEIKMHPSDLIKSLELLRGEISAYKIAYIPKASGGKRKICIPNKLLMTIQRQLNKHALQFFSPAKNVFGFSGGSIIDAITPHLKAKSILCVDIEDAFHSISADYIFNYLIEGRMAYAYHYRPDKVTEYGHFSWHAAKIMVDFTIFQKRLPQGAPTSPKLFDLTCREFDKRIHHIAKNVGGIYTRYADNIFFSMSQEEFPKKIKNAVLRAFEKHKFRPHKIRTRKINQSQALKILGLNLIKNQIHNTRNFKRALRHSIHHVNWMLNNNLEETPEFEKAWQKLQGQIAFARIDTLPRKLLETYLGFEKQLI